MTRPAAPPGALAPVLLAAVLLADLVLHRADLPLVPTGLVDWTGHLATAGLVLLAAGREGLRLPAGGLVPVLAGAVLLDLDHVPLYLGVPGVAAAGGRPLTHGLLALAALLLAGLLARRRPLLLVALGVALHLLRDVATGPGVPLLWPADVVVQVPYVGYAVVMGLLALRAALPARPGRHGGQVGHAVPPPLARPARRSPRP